MKNLVTMAGPDIICASKTKDSEEVLKVSIDLFAFMLPKNYVCYMSFFVLENGKRSNIPVPNTARARS